MTICIVDTYNIEVKLNEKKVRIVIGDKMTNETTENYIREYKEVINSIDTTDMTLEIENRMSVLTPELTIRLRDCFIMYKENNFKEIIIYDGNDILSTMQIKRIVNRENVTCAIYNEFPYRSWL